MSVTHAAEDTITPLIPFLMCPNCSRTKGQNPAKSCNALKMGVDYQQLAQDQAEDPEIQAYRTAPNSLKVSEVPWTNGSFTVLCDISLGKPRPVVPVAWRRHIFDIAHSLSHPGVRTTRRLISNKFVWQGMATQINSWAKACDHCQRAKIHTHTRSPLQQFEIPTRRFQYVHIDIVGPLPEVRGYKYLLTVMDRFTRWPEAIPLKEIDTKSVARAYTLHWVARFGVPEVMVSDRGTQFVSELWTAMSQLLGTQLSHTTAYHPQANGFIERLHRTMKAALKTRLSGPDWLDQLPWVMLGIRSTPKEDLEASPAEMVYGSTLIVPGDFTPQIENLEVSAHLRRLRDTADTLRPIPTCSHGAENIKFNVPKSLTSAKYVYVRQDGKSKPLQNPYDGPFKVLEKGPKVFKLQIGNRTDTVSIDRLKVAITEGEVQVAVPPRRGRPPNNPTQPMPHEATAKSEDSTQKTTTLLPEDKPSYAEITSRSGRTIKPPDRLMY